MVARFLSRLLLAASLCAALAGAGCTAAATSDAAPVADVHPPATEALSAPPVSPIPPKPAPPPVQLHGQFTPGGMVRGSAPAGARVSVDGRDVRVGPAGEFVFGFGRDESGPVAVTVEWPEGRWEEQLELSPREFDIQRVEGVAQKHVTPPPEVTERIRRENAMVAVARSEDNPRLDWAMPFVWPLLGPITGVYGSQRVYNGAPRSPHYGLDIAAPSGAVVVAPAAGVVSLAEPDLYFSGGTLILDHGHGIYSTFIHLSEVMAKPGQRVEQGDPVAKVGATGRATGPHLDWRINWFNTRLDPALWMQGIPMPAQSENVR